jgi:outer membrane protein assembly factor BamE (lipoprotein component of BamABCDE complex)
MEKNRQQKKYHRTRAFTMLQHGKWLLLVGWLCAGCVSHIRTGTVDLKQRYATIVPHQSTRQDVAGTLGSPLWIHQTGGKEDWLYLSQHFTLRSGGRPHLVEQQWVRVMFDLNQPKVELIEANDLLPSRELTLASETTPAATHRARRWWDWFNIGAAQPILVP